MNYTKVLDIATPIVELFSSVCFGAASFTLHKIRKTSENSRREITDLSEEEYDAYFQTDANSAALEGLTAGMSGGMAIKAIVDTIQLFRK